LIWDILGEYDNGQGVFAMRLLIGEKAETLDLEEFEYRGSVDFGGFLFEFLAYDFLSCRIETGREKKEVETLIRTFCEKALAVSELFLFLIWNQMNSFSGDDTAEIPYCGGFRKQFKNFGWYFEGKTDIKKLSPEELNDFVKLFNDAMERFDAVRKSLEKACVFCLDMDYYEHDLTRFTSAQRWYILKRHCEEDDPMWLIGQMCTEVSEETIITGEKEDFFSDSLFHLDGEELDSYFNDPEDMDDFIEKYSNTQVKILKAYQVDGLLTLCYAELWHMVVNGVKIRKCGYCSKYFVPYYENTEYCSRLIEGKNKTCKEYAPMYFYRKKAEDDLTGIYMKADAAHYKRHTRNKDYYTWDQLTAWREKAKEKLELARQGKLSAEELKLAIKPKHIL